MTSLQSGGRSVAARFATITAATLLSGSLAQAQTTSPSSSQVTLYGLVDMAVESVSTGAGHMMRAESGVLAGSRWGLRGTEDLGAGLRALYVMEAGLNADTGERGQGGLGFGRQIYIGMASRPCPRSVQAMWISKSGTPSWPRPPCRPSIVPG